jgi:signal transduction histidine kinase
VAGPAPQATTESLPGDIEQLKGQLRLALEELSQLRMENQQLKETTQAKITTSSNEVEQLEEQLRISLEEITRMNERLFEFDQKLLETQLQSQGTASRENTEVIASTSQELRQPMSSIVGYTELLLSESVGILGAMQRKFIDRIKVSTERMAALVEDLIRVVTIDKGALEIVPEAVNLGVAIDEAISSSVSQFREKNIALRVDLPEQLPQIRADRDALQQVIIHLLHNAGQATPEDGEISLHARIESGDKDDSYVLIQVADMGEGIPPEDLQRVFSRLYRADNPLIPGVGDTGVGLSIVKSLVEAQGGRIWVDSEKGHGSTFSILLPMATLAPDENGIIAENAVPGGNGRGGRPK